MPMIIFGVGICTIITTMLPLLIVGAVIFVILMAGMGLAEWLDKDK